MNFSLRFYRLPISTFPAARRAVSLFAVSLFAALLFSVPTVAAQPVITADDARALFNRGAYASQTASPEAGTQDVLQAVIDQVGFGGTYDFSGIPFAAGELSEGIFYTRPFPSDVPDDPAFADADYVEVSSVFEGDPSYFYSSVEDGTVSDPGGVMDHGNITTIAGDATTTYDPPRQALGLPLTEGTAWGSRSTETEMFLGTTTTSTVADSGQVIGYGTLIAPGGATAESVVYRSTQTTIAEGDTTRTRTIAFLSLDRLLQVAVFVDENDDVLTLPPTNAPFALFFAESEESMLADVSSGDTGPFLGGALGAEVEFTGASPSDGSLRGYRINYPSSNNAVDNAGGSASFTVENVSEDGYWIIEAEDLSDFTYRACLSYDGLGGVNDPGELAVLKRESAGEPWVPLASIIDTGAQTVCADGLDSFSQFAIGGSAANPLPIELGAFTAAPSGEGAVALMWRTFTETRSDGFRIERRSADVPTAAWQALGMRASRAPGGTSTGALRYEFTDRDLPFEAQRLTYRLVQKDLDGTERVVAERSVEIAPPQAFALRAPFPNPTGGQATLRYELPAPQRATLVLYDALGREVRTLAAGEQTGRREVLVSTDGLASGVYFVRLRAGDRTASQRLVVVR